MSDSYNIYRGQDGQIDYGTVIETMAIDDTDVSIVGQDLPPNTIWHYVRRQVRGDGCGLEGESSDPCVVAIDLNGDMRPESPNPPTDVIAEPISGGKIRLRWRYSSAGEEIAPGGFAVYQANSHEFSEVPTSILIGGILPMNEFSWVSDVLADGLYYFVVKSFTFSGGLSFPSSLVTAFADSEGPPAIVNLIAEADDE